MDGINSKQPAEICDILDEKIGLFFTTGVPFLKVESFFFIDLIRTCLSIDPKKLEYPVPCRRTLSRTIIPRIHKRVASEKRKVLENTNSVIIMDGWKSSSNNRKYLTFSLRNFKVHNTYLTFSDFTQKTEDQVTVGKAVVEAIKLAKEKYNTNVFAAVTDNDNKAKAGVRTGSFMLREEDSADLLFLSTCYSHSANLLIKAIVPKDFLDLLKEVVSAFSEPRLQSFIQDHGGVKLKNYPDTRFCFARLTIQTIVKSLKALKSVCEKFPDKIPVKIKDLIHDSNFVRRLLDMTRTLDPICKLINRCQHPSVNVAEGTELWLSLQLDTHQFDEEVQERLDSAISEVGYAANFMHPIYKGSKFDANGDQQTCALNFLNTHLNDDGKLELTQYLQERETYDMGADRFKDLYNFWVYLEWTFPNLSV